MEDKYLFKAKRVDNGEWVTGSLITCEDGTCKIATSCLEGKADESILVCAYDVDRDTICQCTGLKDKNGKLIWGKDIVDGHIKRGAAFLNCLVLWNESKARFDVRAKGCNFPMTLDEVAGDISVGGLDYEVVGNRFDNPELLESEE